MSTNKVSCSTQAPDIEQSTENKLPPANDTLNENAWGWLKLRPRCLQCLKSPKWFLFCISLYSLIQSMAVNSFVSIAIPSLEKRFSFNSKETGFIVSSNDITALLLVSFVSFYGGYGHKTKWLGTGALLTAVGCIVFTVPHFLIDAYDPSGVNRGMSNSFCMRNSTTQNHIKGTECSKKGITSSWYLFVFVCGQLLAGAGTTPLHTLGTAYIDENVSPKYSSFYLGAFYATSMLGPGLGNMIGGNLLGIYVDMKLPTGVSLTTKDARWIGAWWLGPLASGCLLFLIGFILLGFPRQLSSSRKIRDEAIGKGFLLRRDMTEGNLADIIPVTKSLLTNATYMFQNMAITVSAFVAVGMGPFLFKLIRIRYGGTAAIIGIAVAIILIPGAGGGITLGSFIVKKLGLKDSCRKAAKVSFILQLLGMWTAFIFMIPGCNYSKFAGIDVAYPNRTLSGALADSCNSGCNCTQYQYRPLCGPDAVNYFSPCFAGCTSMKGNQSTFTNCSCVPWKGSSRQRILTSGTCDRGCKNIIPFLVGAVVLAALSFSNAIPSKIVTLRSVPDNQRAYALGLQFVFVRTLGSLPGPILFGHLIDTTCTLWRTKCGVRGNCLNYDHIKLGWMLVASAMPIHAVSSLAYFFSWRFCKSIPRTNSNLQGMPLDHAGNDNSGPSHDEKHLTDGQEERGAHTEHLNTACCKA